MVPHPPGTSPDPAPFRVELPPEPCVILSDGDVVTIATDRTCEQIRQWALSVGPIGRAVMTARLRALADLVDQATHDGGA